MRGITPHGGAMESIESVHALRFIRKLRGGSQPILIMGSDGLAYVTKFANNLQGPDVLFNEVLGTEIYRQVGLPVPEWKMVHVSDAFINDNPDAWIESREGLRKPAAGWCFGSQFVGSENSRTLEILPRNYFNKIQNRLDFTKAFVVDTLCGHDDGRQAIFHEESSGRLKAYFIDHGYIFGGTTRHALPQLRTALYFDLEIYADSEIGSADEILDALKSLDASALEKIVDELPSSWKTDSALLRFESFIKRISDRSELRTAVKIFVGWLRCTKIQYGQWTTKCGNHRKRNDLCTQVLASAAIPTICS